MEPLSLALGFAAGAGIGLAAYLSAKNGHAGLVQQVAASKDAARVATEASATHQSALAELKARAAKALQSSNDASAALALATTKAKNHAAELAATAQDAKRATDQLASQRTALQQAEEKARTAQQQAAEAKRRVEALEKQLADAKRTPPKPAAGNTAHGGDGADQTVAALAKASSLDAILQVLLDHEGQTTAVLADTHAIVVVAVGDDTIKEGMAATARAITMLGQQFDGMLPFDAVQSFSVTDQAGVIAGRTFACAGETMSLATYGQRRPADRVLDTAVAGLRAALE